MRSATETGQQEVRTIEDVEGLSFKLQVEVLGEPKVLSQGHIGGPLPGTNELVASQVSDASQTGCGERWQIRLSAAAATGGGRRSCAIKETESAAGAPTCGPRIA